MTIALSIFALLAIALHVYIWYMETFLWAKEAGMRTFGMSREFAESTREMAANQGLYNLMLAGIGAAGLALFWAGQSAVGAALMYAGIGSMLIAGLFLFVTSPSKRRPATIQLTFPLLTVLTLLFV
ncbi:MAG: DUF1304 domain-containing protein [Rothia sp. (in: high G+C Gram-positive bacteria)]|uniref:DUF1304 domain-containing protein n=1 Tax=Rothia sp. (in: high G+C Gram-positive bacteria) TaxID=1885016 RepID=UPI0026DF7972|nr:DUF1304 domain-containing protein [Rothia sp. (in: high G+C Gram-positive bacteria)]MDO5751025.1 DUF1304 domain-containing protein [Rothia sp. (in: high G+C Gram-positive bacteria)]